MAITMYMLYKYTSLTMAILVYNINRLYGYYSVQYIHRAKRGTWKGVPLMT